MSQVFMYRVLFLDPTHWLGMLKLADVLVMIGDLISCEKLANIMLQMDPHCARALDLLDIVNHPTGRKVSILNVSYCSVKNIGMT